MDLVPTIDLNSSASVSLEAVDRACRDHGFFLLVGHGADELIQRSWAQARRFFEAPPAVREAVRRTAERPLGYYDRELTKRQRDRKEVFDYTDPESAMGRKRNTWPSDLPGFLETQTDFFVAMSTLAARTLRLVHSALGLSSEIADAHRGSRITSTVRINHYPAGDPVADGDRAGLPPLADMALGHHTDPGLITLLLQDDTGGLQTQSQDAGWIDVPPRPGTLVVNLGDSLQVWTNDRYRAAVHRVMPVETSERYSIPYFFNPELDAVVQPIAELQGLAPRYRPFTWRQFIRARINDNYADVGAEDTQITQFRI